MGINTNAVQRLYVAYFNRPGDPVGMTHWEGLLPATAATQAQLATIAASFSGSAEYAALYAGQSNTSIVNNLYLNLFGRAAESAGLLSWAGKLTAGTETFASIALQLTYSAQGTDATAIANKLTAANSFTTALDTAAEIVGYSGTAAATSGRTYLAAVTDVAATLTTSASGLTASVAAAVAAGTSAAGTTFTLTTGVDVVAGTTGNDTINATLVTGTAGSTFLNVSDTIDMAAGTDTVNINYAGTAATASQAALPVLTNVEVLNIRGILGNSTVVGSVAPSLTTLGVAGHLGAGTVTVTAAVATMTTITLADNSFDATDFSITYASGAFSGTADSLTLNVAAMSAAATGTATNFAEVAFIGAASGSGLETINVVSTSASRLDALTSTDSVTQTMTNLNVSGAGSFRVNTALNFKGTTGTINASTNTGGVTFDVGTENLTITGGTGNDSITFAAAGDFDASDAVNLGAGTDTIVIADTAVSTTTTVLNTAINGAGAEVIGFSAAASVDMSVVTATTVAMASTTNVALTVTSASATDIVQINTGTAAIADLIVTGALGFNTSNLVLNGSSTASVTMDDLTATTLATVNITSNGTFGTAHVVADLILSTSAVVTITGAQALTVTNAMANTAVVIDGSAMTGILTIIAGTTASSITGGSAADVITGGTGADTLIGGAGADTINSGNDGAVTTVITGGLGADTINLQHASADNSVTTMNVTAAQSYATTSQFDTVVFANNANVNTNTVTLVTAITAASVTGAASVTLGTTTVTAGAYIVVGSAGAGALTGNQNYSAYQDSNSNGIIDSTDLRVDFNDGSVSDTTVVTLVGGQLVVTHTGV